MSTFATYTSASPAQTRQMAAEFAAHLAPGAVLALYGDLGAGKTCFAQGIAKGLGVKVPVASPSFVIINEHQGRCKFYHIDLYRLHSAEELASIGLEEYLPSADGVTLIEWAERAENLLPADCLRIYFTIRDKNTRWIKISTPFPQHAPPPHSLG